MSSKQIGLNLPLDDAEALRDGATLLTVLADRASGAEPVDATTTATPVTATENAGLNMPPAHIDVSSVGAPPVGKTDDTVFDASGLPWDERIHSGSKAVLESGERKGCFRYKRGVDKDLVLQVENELRASLSSPQVAPVVNVEASDATGMVQTPAPVATPPPPQAAPTAPPQAAPAPVPSAPPVAQHQAPQPIDFASLVLKANHAQTQGLMTDVQLNGILGAAGLASINELAARADLFEWFNQQLDANIANAGV